MSLLTPGIPCWVLKVSNLNCGPLNKGFRVLLPSVLVFFHSVTSEKAGLGPKCYISDIYFLLFLKIVFNWKLPNYYTQTDSESTRLSYVISHEIFFFPTQASGLLNIHLYSPLRHGSGYTAPQVKSLELSLRRVILCLLRRNRLGSGGARL
jgi:hypothetical protein